MPRVVTNAKIACLDFSLQKVKMKLGVQLLVSDPDQLDKMRDRESDITKERINKILATGANVILTTGGHYYLFLALLKTKLQRRKSMIMKDTYLRVLSMRRKSKFGPASTRS